jgi:hypothetical protein
LSDSQSSVPDENVGRGHPPIGNSP